MAEVGMDVAAVRALAGDVRAKSDLLDEIRCPTMSSGEMPGSVVASSACRRGLDDRLAGVVAHMRTWAAAAQASAAAIESADGRHARRLGG